MSSVKQGSFSNVTMVCWSDTFAWICSFVSALKRWRRQIFKSLYLVKHSKPTDSWIIKLKKRWQRKTLAFICVLFTVFFFALFSFFFYLFCFVRIFVIVVIAALLLCLTLLFYYFCFLFFIKFLPIFLCHVKEDYINKSYSMQTFCMRHLDSILFFLFYIPANIFLCHTIDV